jgi:hypothetical protein
MITEDYVSFETAKLLKEKGFNESCHCYYTDKGKFVDMAWNLYEKHNTNSELNEFSFCSAPTLQMTMKWLREARNIDIEVHADVGMLGVKVYTPFISRYKSSTEHPSKLRQYKKGLYFEDDRGVIPAIKHFETYEEAIEVALKYALEKLI